MYVFFRLAFARAAARGTTNLSRHILSPLNFGCAQRYRGTAILREKFEKKDCFWYNFAILYSLYNQIYFLLYKVTQRHRCTLSITCTVKIVEQTIKEYISCGRSLIGSALFYCPKKFSKKSQKNRHSQLLIHRYDIMGKLKQRGMIMIGCERHCRYQ